MRSLLLPGLLLLSTLASSAAPSKKPPLAYYCASGWQVSYHTTPTCWGLRNCGATVKPIALAKAKQQMRPCRVCH